MKNTLFFAGAFMCSTCALGQNISPLLKRVIPSNQQAHFNKIQQLVSRQNAHVAAQKPTGIKQRVIAQVGYEDGDIDSTAFTYSGSRGSRFDYNNMYDLRYKDYLPDLYYYNDPSEGLPTDMLADKISIYDNYNTGILEINNQYEGHYRSDNQLDTIFDNDYNQGEISFSEMYVRAYNSQGYLTDVYEYIYNSMTDSDYTIQLHQKLYYNQDYSLVLSDTIWNATPNDMEHEYKRTTKYSYNNNHQLTEAFEYDYFSGSFLPNEKTTITYNNGRVATVVISDPSLPGLMGLDSKDSFVYTAGVDYITGWYEEVWSMGDLDYASYILQYPGANGLPDSLVSYSRMDVNDPYQKEGALFYTYNSYGNPEQQRIVFSDDFPLDSINVRFYYETYDDGTDIEHFEKNADELQVYPNPFSREINIDWRLSALYQVEMKLFDNAGRLVSRQEMNLTTGNNTISVPELPAGVYLLQLQDLSGKQWSRKLIKK